MQNPSSIYLEKLEALKSSCLLEVFQVQNIVRKSSRKLETVKHSDGLEEVRIQILILRHSEF
jgi:hypothetical protein